MNTLLCTLLEIASLLFVTTAAITQASIKPNQYLGSIAGLVFDYSFVVTFATALSFSLLLLTFAMERGLVSKCLRIRTLVFLGEASYAVFLVHYAVLLAFRGVFPEQFQWSYALILTLAISIALHLWIENPSRIMITGAARQLAEGRKMEFWQTTIKLCRRLAALLAVTCLLAPLSMYWTGNLELERWKQLTDRVITGSTNIRFGASVELLGAKLVVYSADSDRSFR